MSNEIMEGNRLIAEFMGWTKSPYDNTPNKMYKGVNSSHIDSFIYHTSWDWLMPVFIKIGTMWMWQVDKFGCTICVLGRPPIEYGVTSAESNNEESIKRCAWLACVDFIRWYNENKKN